MFTIVTAGDPQSWDGFLSRQRFRPFLQSWTMGDVYGDLGQEAVRLEIRKNDQIVGICFAHVVPARRGKHLSIPYGPLFSSELTQEDFVQLLPLLYNALKSRALAAGCGFVRMSPFLSPEDGNALQRGLQEAGASTHQSPLHLLAEQLWYLPLTTPDRWSTDSAESTPRSSDEIFQQLRKTTRNLVRRAEKDGVTIEKSSDPVRDLAHFITLHDETRKRHGFTPYTNTFFRLQVEHFAKRGEVSIYLAHFQNQVIAASVHMHAFGETSYHHGASADAFKKIPASYLLQWTAIQDALKRGDRVYNFWGIAPTTTDAEGTVRAEKGHPFAGVTLFKTGFGGSCLQLTHCLDLALQPGYRLTRLIEVVRKWKRGF